MTKFYDTCSLLNSYKSIFGKGEKFYYSSITVTELENLKTSANKTEEIRYSARTLAKLLKKFPKIAVPILYTTNMSKKIGAYNFLDNNDSQIVATALYQSEQEDIIFVTDDTNCYLMAKALGLTTETLQTKEDNYTGYKEVVMDEDELILFYSCTMISGGNPYDLLTNEYLVIKDENGNIDDYYKWTGEKYEDVKKKIFTFSSTYLGDIKPYKGDTYQKLAMDMLMNSKISVLRGPAGSGKSHLALGFLLSLLNENVIDKIIIFCNTVATKDSAKLGYYPGSRTEKLLDSQIGNFLESKIGDRSFVEKMIADGVLVLLPMSDIRGYDTSGMHAGIYITEAQNLSIDLMKLALQRVGNDCICILDGDDTSQVDLNSYAGSNNGLREVSRVFRGSDIYGEITLKKVFRSEIAELAQQMGENNG